tara:strand:- start:1922 stop:2515 length:594 start_codon:yes stop_codon:yes gene_type:complete
MLRLERSFLVDYLHGITVGGTVRVALSGTPGTGKTTVSSLLREAGNKVLSVEILAEKFDCIEETDPNDGAKPIDVELLCSILRDDWFRSPKGHLFVDGHLSHLLPVDCVIILRCNPVDLQRRLEDRGYAEGKVLQNVDWEILGGPWNEVDKNTPIIEFDSSSESSESIFEAILNWIADGFKPERPANPIDWVDKGVM